jgi:hypothetical protein
MKTSFPPILTEQHKRVLYLRDVCRYRFRDIGHKLGVSGSRAGQIYGAAVARREATPECFRSLTVRTVHVLRQLNLNTREEVVAALADGRLSLKRGPRNYGKQCLLELLKWLGLFKR